MRDYLELALQLQKQNYNFFQVSRQTVRSVIKADLQRGKDTSREAEFERVLLVLTDRRLLIFKHDEMEQLLATSGAEREKNQFSETPDVDIEKETLD